MPSEAVPGPPPPGYPPQEQYQAGLHTGGLRGGYLPGGEERGYQQGAYQQSSYQEGAYQQGGYQQGAPIGYAPGGPDGWEQNRYGYQYREMPSYPQPSFPPTPHRPGSRIPAWVWVFCATVLALGVALAGLLAGGVPRPSGDPTDRDTPDDYLQPNSESTGEFTGEILVERLNLALAEQDRDGFFQFVGGSAEPALSLWWDNMEELGWTGGAFGLITTASTYTDDQIEVRVLFGAAQAGTPVIPGHSDHPDASLAYAPSRVYEVTIDVTDDGAAGVIVDWGWDGAAAPWDLEPLYAVVSENSVVAGYTDERPLVDDVAGPAQESAAWVVQTYEEATGVANAQSYLTFVSSDPNRFNDWFIEDTSGWYGDRAGTMFTQFRPIPAPGVAPDLATGDARASAGGILTVGPNGLQYGMDSAQMVITHEFVHAIHTTNVPIASWPGSTTMEGWATYLESLFEGDGEFAAANTYLGRAVRYCAQNNFSGRFPTQEEFVDVVTAECAYMLSGTIYAYADSIGVDAFALADESLATGHDLPTTAERIGSVPLDENAWADWVEETFAD